MYSSFDYIFANCIDTYGAHLQVIMGPHTINLTEGQEKFVAGRIDRDYLTYGIIFKGQQVHMFEEDAEMRNLDFVLWESLFPVVLDLRLNITRSIARPYISYENA